MVRDSVHVTLVHIKTASDFKTFNSQVDIFHSLVVNSDHLLRDWHTVVFVISLFLFIDEERMQGRLIITLFDNCNFSFQVFQESNVTDELRLVLILHYDESQ